MLIVDIGSATVGAAIVGFAEEEKPRVYYHTRRIIAPENKEDKEWHRHATFEALLSLLIEVQQHRSQRSDNNSASIDSAACFFSTLWSTTKPVSFSVSRNESFEVTPELFERYISREQQKLEEAAGDERAEVIEQRITQMKLNGYPTRNPWGKRVTRLDVSLLMSSIEESFLKRVESIIGQFFTVETIQYYSHPLTSISVIPLLMKEIEHYVFVHVGGSITTAGLVHNARLGSLEYIAKGDYFFIQSISEQLSVAPEEARAYIREGGQGALHPNVAEKLQAALDTAAQAWLSDLTAVLENMSSGKMLPRTLYLFDSGTGIASRLRGSLRKELSINEAPSAAHPFNVVVIGREQVRDRCVVPRGFPADLHIMLEAVFLHHEGAFREEETANMQPV